MNRQGKLETKLSAEERQTDVNVGCLTDKFVLSTNTSISTPNSLYKLERIFMLSRALLVTYQSVFSCMRGLIETNYDPVQRCIMKDLAGVWRNQADDSAHGSNIMWYIL